MKAEQIGLIFFMSILGCAHTGQTSIFYRGSEASEIVDRGWRAVYEKKYDDALQISNQCIEQYAEQAKQLNDECEVRSMEKYAKCQLFNDTAQCLFIKTKVYIDTGNKKDAIESCNELKKKFFNAFVFDSHGWPWKPSEACYSLIHKS